MNVETFKKEAHLSSQFCVGIDPQGDTFEAFQKAFQHHCDVMDELLLLPEASLVKWVKPNLAFFLRHGALGIQLLESLVNKYKTYFKFLLDAKFSEIANSLSANLDFAFLTLKSDAVTLNPFFGEESIKLALEKIKKIREENKEGVEKKIFILCQTSESSTSNLQYIQQFPEEIVRCTLQLSMEMFGNCQNIGFVVGAKKLDLFCQNPKIISVFKELNVMPEHVTLLCPGLGVQGGALSLALSKYPFQVIFPISRYLFQPDYLGVNHSLQKLTDLLQEYR